MNGIQIEETAKQELGKESGMYGRRAREDIQHRPDADAGIAAAQMKRSVCVSLTGREKPIHILPSKKKRRPSVLGDHHLQWRLGQSLGSLLWFAIVAADHCVQFFVLALRSADRWSNK